MDIFKLFNKSEAMSKSTAKERLRIMLVHDRISVSPDLLEMMKDDIIAVISKYVEVDTAQITVSVSEIRDEDNVLHPSLLANIPIIQAKPKKTEE